MVNIWQLKMTTELLDIEQINASLPIRTTAENEHWLLSSLDTFAEVLYVQEDQDVATWADIFSAHLAPHIKGVQVALYMQKGNSLYLVGGYALQQTNTKDQPLAIGEGIVGKVAKYNEPVFLQDDSINYQENLGTVSFQLAALVALPLAFNKKVCGVLEVLFMEKPKQIYIDLLQRLTERIAANLNLFMMMDKLAESKKVIQAKNENIWASINYAKKIQNTFLPSEAERLQIFSESFVIYKPLHIVSGDFYWLSVHDPIRIACIFDCTGHGIPAAFVSLLGYNLINEAIKQNFVYAPADIVAWLNYGIYQRMRNGNDKIDDGMDIGICTIQPLENEQFSIRYAGAKHNLFFSQAGKIEKLQSDKFSLGTAPQCEPNEQEIILQKGEMLYLLTDGYTDQANKDRKRFGTPKLMKLLEKIYTLPLHTQEYELRTTFENHSHEVEQRDDVTCIGLKLMVV